ncbi:MAG: tRNA threonylcarbamoyladenosine dehydratase [Candidatus Omnitrophica bacterium]|nr:tRNA threonylcarbamoyladenosine dehydratase [Candidatus Omnitrophota bacterium]
MKKLAASSVTVIGLGAVGSYCLEALARAGVGRFRVVDFDVIRPSNMNRHLWAFHSTLNIPKAEMAKKRLLDINPDILVEPYVMFADDKTLPQILDNKPDILIDAADAAGLKVETLERAYKMGLTIVSSMGAATRTDLSCIQVGDLMDSKGCPLARRMRRLLKPKGVGRGITCVYSTQPQKVSLLSSEPVVEPGDVLRGRIRRKLGSLSTVTGIFGLTLAHTVLKKLLEF